VTLGFLFPGGLVTPGWRGLTRARYPGEFYSALHAIVGGILALRPVKLVDRAIQAAAIIVGVLVLGFYLQRVAMPQPLYTWDEDGFAIQALFSPEIIARNPFAPSHSNGAFIGLIRIAYAISRDYLPLLRGLNAAFYFGGILMVAGVATRSLPPMRRLAWVAIALAFPYYRFVISGLPEGMYVGVLAAFAAATALLYRRRPLAHGLIAGCGRLAAPARVLGIEPRRARELSQPNGGHQPTSLSHQPGIRPSSRMRIGISTITKIRPDERVTTNGAFASRKYIAVTMRR